MSEELAIGHLGRIMWLNGVSGLAELSTAISGTELVRRYTRKTAFRYLLSAAAGTDLETYGFHHSLIPFLRNVDHYGAVPVSSLHSDTFRGQVDHFVTCGLRCCVLCIEADMESGGFSWFRRAHQLIGIDWCLVHGIELHAIDADAPYLACPHTWQERRLIRPCGAQWPRVEQVPNFVKRFIFAFMAISNRTTPLRADELHGFISQSVGRSAPPGVRSSSNLLFPRIEALAPADWLECSWRTLRTTKVPVEYAISLAACARGLVQTNVIYSLAIAALPATDWSEFLQLIGPNTIAPEISLE